MAQFSVYSRYTKFCVSTLKSRILIDGQGPGSDDEPLFIKTENNFDEYFVLQEFWKQKGLVLPNAYILRTVEILIDSFPTYVITDNIKNTSLFSNRTASFNLNGNGNTYDSSFYFLDNTKNRAVWDYPCRKDNDRSDNYKMLLTFTSFFEGQTASSELDTMIMKPNGNFRRIYHPNLLGNNTFKQNDIGGVLGLFGTYNSTQVGFHTRVFKDFFLNPGDQVQFKSTIQVIPCNSPSDQMVRYQTNPKYTLHIVSPHNNLFNLFFSKINSNYGKDTSQNPFGIDANSVLETDAKFLLFSYSTNPEFKSGNCVSYCNFRKARIAEGRLFKYHDTTYIESSKVATAYYSLIGKCKYKAYIETDTACTVSFYLADLDTGVGMKVNGLPYTYNTLTCMMQVDVPIGLTQFEIELEDPCRVSCFFPSTAETIDGQFDFSEGITQTLGHKLSIVKPNGFLNITNGSHMMLCDGIYLHNRDSLVLYSGCGKDTGQVSISTCNGAVNGTPFGAMSGAGGGAKPSTLSVKAGAALILEDSSFTQISNNSELHVWVP
jgi:hypothetical protein